MSSPASNVFQEILGFDPKVPLGLPVPAKSIPPSVWDGMKRVYVEDNANVARGIHKLTGVHLRLRAIAKEAIPFSILKEYKTAALELVSYMYPKRRLYGGQMAYTALIQKQLRVMHPALKVFVEFCGDKDIGLDVPAEVSYHLAWSGEAVKAPTIPLPADADPFDVSSAFHNIKKLANGASTQEEEAPTPKKHGKQPKSPAIIYDSDVEIVGTENGGPGAASTSTSSTRGGKAVARGRGGRGGGPSRPRTTAGASAAVVRVPYYLVPNLDLSSPAFLKATQLGKRARVSLDAKALEEVNKNALTSKYPNLFPDGMLVKTWVTDHFAVNNEWVNGVLSQVQNILANYSDAVNVGSSTRATLTDIRSEILRRDPGPSGERNSLLLREKDLPSSSVESPASPPPLEADSTLGGDVDAAGDVDMTEA
ncbi:hypothetical protein CC1G_02405 [Coprinopsis cinerea okayama7|uniref:Uncharacterized protein n=1 Tax=Coprinopsis cinerea (strain Okayama-7 / 130 / ATCC MYA-4618 / FGSC 9003) TaxID=240176 RepID=A8N7Z8_COPC7|nr:hypothetical protein CC1G_02405 [Coprinopsis cinerea okayama7\|eukprot:XP_001830954.2 hypothetical protein CC1G_02405 [Coprinopsis cinerea okayama7\